MRVDDVVFDGSSPVDEDRALSIAVLEAVSDPISEYLDKQKKIITRAVAAVGIGIIIGGGMLVTGVGGTVALLILVGGVAAGMIGYGYASTQDPDVTIKGIDKAHWTVYGIPDNKGIVLYDANKTIDDTTFEVDQITDTEVIDRAAAQLDSPDDFPVVMPSDTNVEQNVTDTLEQVQSEINAAEQHTREMPIMQTDAPQSTGISEITALADIEQNSYNSPVDIELDEARSDVESLSTLQRISATDEDDAKLRQISQKSQQLVDDLSGMQQTAIELLNDHITMAADAFGIVSYNFYCPSCLEDDIESEVTISDPEAGEWYCETCRSYHDMGDTVPRHRLKDDVVTPVCDQLWIEKDDERRRIYEKIEDQKQELQEREFEERREEIRSATDRIKDLRSRIRDLKTQAKAARGTVEQISSLMVRYERLGKERKEEFRRDVQDSFAEIDKKTQEVLEQTQHKQQKRLEEAEQAAKEKAELMRLEQRQRDAEILAAQQQLEAEATQAVLAQNAQQHEAEMSMEKRQHRENWMLKTRGRVSASGLINRTKMKKDRLIGVSARTDGGGR
ncbi:hypothetical protein K0C01_02315 [Salinarchaeum sp. IM2453]|uniref:hypothetical protein n=1 Tax=Salinarchaeum sp. IM2453 TaxID=2862870 RepID=UPI001C82A2D9|nr:hypothetical protein [Salinarchaeum sp. IM2453]QZA89020.1 hypothetical protein K0C01_02315 [Salinarchaeum sp. IM2453]